MYISESKVVRLSVSYNDASWDTHYCLEFYDSEELAVPEFSYSCLSDIEFPDYSDADFLADKVDDFLTERFSRGLCSVSDGDTLDLVI
jgi:hypothetical protein